MLYHPVANTIIQILEKRIVRYTKDFYEISHIQSAEGSAERFASVSVSTFTKSFEADLFDKFFGTVYTSTLLGTLEEKKFGEKPLYLLFNPIDSFINFSRGISNFGISFLLQEETRSGLENIFSLTFSFQTQEVIYSDFAGCYIKGRPLKTVIRKTPKLCVASCNTQFLKTQAESLRDFKAIHVSGSIIDDFHLIAKGKVDIMLYKGVSVANALPVLFAAKSLAIAPSNSEIPILSKEISGKGSSFALMNKYLRDATQSANTKENE